MNQMIEAWKEIPDLPEEFAPLPESKASSKRRIHDFLMLFTSYCYRFFFILSDFCVRN